MEKQFGHFDRIVFRDYIVEDQIKEGAIDIHHLLTVLLHKLAASFCPSVSVLCCQVAQWMLAGCNSILLDMLDARMDISGSQHTPYKRS